MKTQFRNVRVKRLDKLSQKQQLQLLSDLLVAFQMIHNPREVALFVQDLFTAAEIKNLAKRLRIAKRLLSDRTYEEIEKELHTSHGTVAKVGVWLKEKGEGFRRIVGKLPDDEPKEEGRFAEVIREWKSAAHQYPRYFLFHSLFSELEQLAIEQKNIQLTDLLSTLKEKRRLHKEIEAPYKKSKNIY